MASVSVRAAPLVPKSPKIPLRILDSYLVRELALPFGASLGVFLLFQLINIFFLAADFLIGAHAPPFLVMKFLVLRVPLTLPFAFPFATLFAMLLAFGRLTADNEIMALRAAGIPFLRIARTPLILGAAIFGFAYLVNEYVAPNAISLSTRTFYQIVYGTKELPIVPQFFRKDDTTGRVFYVGSVDPDHRTMHDIMIFEPATSVPFRTVMNAETGTIDNNALVLQNVRVVRFKRTGELETFHQELPKETVSIGLPLGENADQFLNTANSDLYMLNSKQLRTQINTEQATGQGGTSLDLAKITLAQKLSFPFASFIAVVVALPLSVRFGKKGRFLGIAMSFVVFFIYYLMMSACTALGKNEILDPYLAAWLPNIITGLAGAYAFWQVER